MSAIIRCLVPATSQLRARAIPSVIGGARSYSEGSVSRDPGWQKKEKAVEDQYAHNREMEVIKKMKEKLETQKKDLEEQERQLQELEKKTKGA